MRIVEKVFNDLLSEYGPQGWWPLVDRNSSPLRCIYVPENTTMAKSRDDIFEICTGAILTQNTSWSNAERALISLIQADYLCPGVLSEADSGIVARLIVSSGYYNMKAKKLKNFSAFFLTDPQPDRKLFLEQWGLGPETVDDMLLYAYDQPIFVIDLYTKRLFSRLGICDEKISYEELQTMIENKIDKDVSVYKEFHALIVRNAKEHCKKSPNCIGCALSAYCIFKKAGSVKNLP